jgi:hypothetical protein
LGNQQQQEDKMSDEGRGSGITSTNIMKGILRNSVESYGLALTRAGVKGKNKTTNEESFKSGMLTLLHHLKQMGVVVVVVVVVDNNEKT